MGVGQGMTDGAILISVSLDNGVKKYFPDVTLENGDGGYMAMGNTSARNTMMKKLETNHVTLNEKPMPKVICEKNI